MELKKHLVLSDKDKRLRASCDKLDVKNISSEEQELIDQMMKYIDICFQDKEEEYGIRPGIALAGPQVGLMKQVIYIHFKEGETEHKYLLANPQIVSHSMQIVCLQKGEGCLSVNEEHLGLVPRYKRVIVEAYDLLNNKPVKIDNDTVLSVCLQHEIDHLNGVLYYDHINKKDPDFKKPEWIIY